MKVNYDGGLNKENKVGGLGVIIHDSEGVVLSAHADNIKGVIDSWAAVRALGFARDMG